MMKRLKQWMKRRHAVASTGLLEREPTDAEAYSACMYMRHDFGLLPSHERKEMMFDAREWLHAWRKVNEDSSNTGVHLKEDESLNMLRELSNYLKERFPHSRDAPGHSHIVDGRWDNDGSECAYCSLWKRINQKLSNTGRDARREGGKDNG